MIPDNAKMLNALFKSGGDHAVSQPWLHLELADNVPSLSRAEIFRVGVKIRARWGAPGAGTAAPCEKEIQR